MNIKFCASITERFKYLANFFSFKSTAWLMGCIAICCVNVNSASARGTSTVTIKSDSFRDLVFVVSKHKNCIDGFFNDAQNVIRLPARGDAGSYKYHRSHRDECSGKQAVFGLSLKGDSEEISTAANRRPDIVLSCNHFGKCRVFSSEATEQTSAYLIHNGNDGEGLLYDLRLGKPTPLE